jgi:ATP-dependent DNA helicase RecG
MLKFNALQSAKVSESLATKNQDVTKETESLALLREDASMTTTEMAQKLFVNRRTVQRELEKLKKKKCIERKGGRRYGYWEIHE